MQLIPTPGKGSLGVRRLGPRSNGQDEVGIRKLLGVESILYTPKWEGDPLHLRSLDTHTCSLFVSRYRAKSPVAKGEGM